LRYSFVLLIGSNLLMLLMGYLLRRFRGEQPNAYTVGYSG
jgi:hypothetical protein